MKLFLLTMSTVLKALNTAMPAMVTTLILFIVLSIGLKQKFNVSMYTIIHKLMGGDK